jgi:hypothetical protein
MIYNPKMPSEYSCPSCNSKNIIVYDDHIECTECNLSFFIEDLDSDMDDENILSEQEVRGFLDVFQDELKDEKERKKFLKSIEDDLR